MSVQEVVVSYYIKWVTTSWTDGTHYYRSAFTACLVFEVEWILPEFTEEYIYKTPALKKPWESQRPSKISPRRISSASLALYVYLYYSVPVVGAEDVLGSVPGVQEVRVEPHPHLIRPHPLPWAAPSWLLYSNRFIPEISVLTW